jgi:pSer/pThr/pTyr-binding forkhead associated (FHA) protein
MFKLELKFQNITLREYSLQDGTTLSIGRDPKNDIVLDDPSISHDHAYIEREGNNVFLWDKGSRRGTYVNGNPVNAATVRNGDVISVGVKYNLTASIPSE